MTWYQRRGKFNARKTEFNGRKFDSKHEASVAFELEAQKRAGEIRGYRCQVPFDLKVAGHKICTHVVDFVVTLNDGSQKILEAKGFATDVWRIKRNLFIALHPEIPYEVVTARPAWPSRTWLTCSRRRAF